MTHRKFRIIQALLPIYYLVLLILFWPLVWAFYPRRPCGGLKRRTGND